jgi:hypothetical protein
MDEDSLNMAIRKFLKVVGVTSQREIEKSVRQAFDEGRLTGNQPLKAKMVLSIPAIGLHHEIEEDIALD